MIASADSQECTESAPCHPHSFLEFGPWVLEHPKFVTHCDDYQVLVVSANGTDMLFLDETAHPRIGKDQLVEHGMSFGEFNFYEASYQIETVSCKVIGPDKVQVSGAASSDDNSNFRFVIVVDTAQRSYTYRDTQPN
jgi:hypothetical protein